VEIRYERPIHWILFTHGNCYREVVDFFDENRSFGLKNVHIFQQNSLPMITPSGQFILDSKYSIAQGPDGSGELLRLFCGNDSIAEMLRGRGVEYLTYFHIDNPLAQPFDLPSIGFIEIAQAQVSSRCAHKLYADERVDVFAEVNGCTSVIEHDNLPLECVGAMDISNRLRFGLANVDMHLFRMDFLQSLCSNEQWEGLRLRMQPTRIPFVNEKGMLVRPQAANAVQLTHNISDILPFAQKVLLVSGVREEIFSPVRNVAGINSAQTAKRDLVRRFASWLSRGKAELPVDDNGVCPFSIEISPLFALSEEEFLEKWSKLNPKPAACENFYIE
jgi:UDP-N-acetylglucosamine pyrophosphorylase